MGKTAVAIDLTEIHRRELASLASRRKTAQRIGAAGAHRPSGRGGADNKDISLCVGAAPNTVGKWRRRFAEHRLGGLLDEPRPGGPRQIGDDAIAETIRLTLETTPRGATHWSLPSMARAVGFAPSTIALAQSGRTAWHFHRAGKTNAERDLRGVQRPHA